VGDLSKYDHGQQIIRLTGLNLIENSSGKRKGKTGISKRGSWVGNALEDYTDGTRVLFIIGKVTGVSEQTTTPEPASEPTTDPNEVHYANCAAVKAAGAAPIRTREPGYSFSLDRDKDK
jgi:hypothetical protein